MAEVRPSELESQVLAVLWERGPSVVRDVQEALPDGKQRAYTTVLTTLQVMEKKGFVAHTREGLAHVYRPLVWLTRLPGLSHTLDLGYRLFARNRLKLTGRCTAETCSLEEKS